MYYDYAEKRMAEDLRLRGRSERTVESYVRQVQLFARYWQLPLNSMDVEHVRKYLVHLKEVEKLSGSTINQAHYALKFLFLNVLDKPWKKGLIRCHRLPRRLPEILTRGQVADLIRAATSITQRTVLMTFYSTGLRISEVVHLKPADIDSKKMRVHIHLGKGKKDRYVMLSERLLEQLRRYWKSEHPKNWLFPSPIDPQRPLSTRTISRFISQAAGAAGIKKRISAHTLRHCFATHLLETGTNLRYLQELLGHNSLNTTMIYLKVRAEHAAKVASPLDQLGL